ncbi:MAG TPA: S8 family serine peptidase [Symbiobacteriaceae bacterium]
MDRVGALRRQPPWHLRRTGFPAAWKLAASRLSPIRPVHIAILDSGVALDHPMLRPLLGEGINLLRPGEPPVDENGHGTHVAGVIAWASGCWYDRRSPPRIRLHPVKIFDQAGVGRVRDIVEGLRWCIQHGMQIVNLSFGTDQKTSPSLHEAIRQAQEAGILLIGAAGNDGRSGAVDYPGRYPEVVAVGSCNRWDRPSRFSSAGPGIDLIAPGSAITSLAPEGGFVQMSGTSMAAPHVTAAAALLLALEPHLTPEAVRKRLKASAEWLPGVPGRAQGAGLLRADHLLRWGMT